RVETAESLLAHAAMADRGVAQRTLDAEAHRAALAPAGIDRLVVETHGFNSCSMRFAFRFRSLLPAHRVAPPAGNPLTATGSAQSLSLSGSASSFQKRSTVQPFTRRVSVRVASYRDAAPSACWLPSSSTSS